MIFVSCDQDDEAYGFDKHRTDGASASLSALREDKASKDEGEPNLKSNDKNSGSNDALSEESKGDGVWLDGAFNEWREYRVSNVHSQSALYNFDEPCFA